MSVWRGRAALALLLVLGCAAACGDEGGELRDATARRRAELANGDTAAETTGAQPPDSAGDSRLPAFAGDTVARVAATAADSTHRDSAAAPGAGAWSLAARSGGNSGTAATLRGLRSASQFGFDRLVLDFGTDAVPGWHAEYTARPGARCGSGEPAEVAGERFLRLRLQTAQAHDDQGSPTVRQRELALNMPALRALAMTCDFEGEVDLVLGVSAARPFRVLQLQSPTRLVVDVQQQP